MFIIFERHFVVILQQHDLNNDDDDDDTKYENKLKRNGGKSV